MPADLSIIFVCTDITSVTVASANTAAATVTSEACSVLLVQLHWNHHARLGTDCFVFVFDGLYVEGDVALLAGKHHQCWTVSPYRCNTL